jgi:hypothetical protein
MSLKSNLNRKKKKEEFNQQKKQSLQRAKEEGVNEKLLNRVDKIKDNGKISFNKKPFKEKASQIIINFAQPLLDITNNEDETSRAINLAIVAWDIAVFQDEERQKNFDMAVSHFKYTILQKAELEKLIKRKDEFFPQYNFLVQDFEIDFNEVGDLNLSVAVAIKDE